MRALIFVALSLFTITLNACSSHREGPLERIGKEADDVVGDVSDLGEELRDADADEYRRRRW